MCMECIFFVAIVLISSKFQILYTTLIYINDLMIAEN